ncbi:uncharacterized protein LOC118438120 [Folsomia candida]|uniref:uncharacterized protein LOC118438120 n=1 Tax=Folsomia candida TaxID=158441 RepID=UPI00160528F4|nr:uncharacterized protein LOC118438120 [Folsomia candida]
MGSVPDWVELQGAPPVPFFKRVLGTLIPLFSRLQHVTMYEEKFKLLFVDALGLKVAPGQYEMEASTCLLLSNAGHLEDYPRSLPPFVVKVPGIHIRDDVQKEELDPKLETIISSNTTDDSFIYISFGTAVNSVSLPVSHLKIFFRAMEAFPKMKFIWRWKGPMPITHPPNLHLIDWVNQQKLLCRSNRFSSLNMCNREIVS